MLVKCINPRFVHVHWGTDANGKRAPKRIRVGDTFPVKGIPAEWRGMVIPVEGVAPAEAKIAVTNPAEGEELETLKTEYKIRTGNAPHYTWDEDRIREKLAELDEES